MGRLWLSSEGLKFSSEKEKAELIFATPLVGFYNFTPREVTVEEILDSWIKVYQNHLEFYLNGMPENSPGFKFGKVGITDSITERHERHLISYHVVEGKLIRQQVSEITNPNVRIPSKAALLYLEGPDESVKKFFQVIKLAMRKALVIKPKTAASAI